MSYLLATGHSIGIHCSALLTLGLFPLILRIPPSRPSQRELRIPLVKITVLF